MALTRIWCLYEVSQGEVYIAPERRIHDDHPHPPHSLTQVWQTFLAKGVAGLLVLTSNVDGTLLQKVFDNFDVAQAQATQPDDRVRILREVEASIGATQLNLQLKQAIVESAANEADRIAGTRNDLPSVQNKAGAMLRSIGMYERAESHYLRAYEISKRRRGSNDESTLNIANNLANCINDQGRHAEAEVLLRQALDGRQRVLGFSHPLTLDSINNLSVCINAQGRYIEAEPHYRRAVDGKKRVLGPDNPSTLDSIINLAGCFYHQGRYAEAEPLFRQAEEGYVRVLGPSHPRARQAKSSLALVSTRRE